MAVNVGDEAPDFELRDQDNQPVRLSDFRGKRPVVIVFYPLAFSSTCEGELCTLRDELASFNESDAAVLAISVDSRYVHREWAQKQGYTFPLLADFWPHGEIARAYGVFDESKGFAVRGTFVIDVEGIVRWKVVNDIADARATDDYRQALADLAA